MYDMFKLLLLKDIFLSNDYPKNYINTCFKQFMNNIQVATEAILKVEKKPPLLTLLSLGVN